MALPEITVPVGTPPFLVAGHSINESDLFASGKKGTGHTRKRRLYTVSERRVAVSLVLDAEQMVAFDAWFEYALLVGKQPFAAQVANQDGYGSIWWRAVWDAPYQADPIGLGRWIITGTLLLSEEASSSPPIYTSATLRVSFPLKGSALIVVPAVAVVSVGMALLKSLDASSLSLGFALTKFISAGAQPAAGSLAISGYAPTVAQTTDVVPVVVDDANLTLAQQTFARPYIPPVESLPILATQIFGA